MKIAILGTGMVGRSHAAKLAELGHEVMVGTHDVKKTMEVTKPDAMGTPPFSEWHKDHSAVKLGTFNEASEHGEIVYDALKGEFAVEVLKGIKTEHLEGKILIDIANALDFSKGMPPSLLVCNTDSLGEQVQRALPNVKVVKTFNTMSAPLQVNPRQLADGDHDIFVCGNDEEAKAKVIDILKNWYGWKEIIDLGDISMARGTEMLLPIWLRLWGKLKTPIFNIKVIK